MNKTDTSDLSLKLQKQHNLSKEDSENFINLMFEVLNEGLRLEKLVKIKGLGTFKVLKVNARKSIDINTGSPITIEERNKITFIPEQGLKELINRPFSQFETVVLNDGVEFDEGDSNNISENESEVLNEIQEEELKQELNQELKQELKQEKKEEKKKEKKEEKKDVLINNSSESNSLEIINDNDAIETDERCEDNFSSSTFSSSFSESTDNIEKEIEVSKPLNVSHEAETQQKEQNKDIQSIEILQDQMLHAKSIIKMLTFSTLILAIVCCIGAFLIFRQFTFHKNYSEQDKSQEKTIVENKVLKNNPKNLLDNRSQQNNSKTKPTNDGQNDNLSNVASYSAKSTNNKIDKQKQESNNIQESRDFSSNSSHIASSNKTLNTQDNHQNSQSSSLYDKDPRVRTGAYRIVGIDQIITVHKSQTLASLSRAYLGSGMECYVEAINGIKEVQVGQKLKIPKLELKKKK